MKSFSQFLQESYLNEEEARQGSLMTRSGKPQDFRNPKKTPFTATDPTPTPASRRLPAGAPEAPKASPGQLEIPEPKSTKVSGSKFRNAGEARQGSLFTKSGKPQNFTGGRTPFVGTDPVKATKRLPAAAPEAPRTSPGQLNIPEPKTTTVASPTTTPSSGPTGTPPKGPVRPSIGNVSGPASSPKPPKGPVRPSIGNVSGPASNPKPPSGGKPPTGAPPSGASSAAKETQKAITKTAGKGILKTLGRVAGPAAAALDVADERSKGSGWARSLAKGAVVAAGGALGGAAGSVAGPVGTVAGATGGSMAASKAFDVAAGANAKERKSMATANRQKQAGSAVKGIGGKTTFDTKKNTITTGSGAQRKTVGLAKTGVVQRGGQSVAGNLAYKGGKAVYKAGPSAQSLAKTSSNPLERVGRSLFAGAYKKSDAANAAKKLATARASDAARNLKLGVKSKPAG
jgi:hypothetical protein